MRTSGSSLSLVRSYAEDKFDENKHPRKDDGKFGSGGGGSDKKSDSESLTKHKDFSDEAIEVGDEKSFEKAQSNFKKMFGKELSVEHLHQLVGVEGMFKGADIEYTMKPYGADGIDYKAEVMKDGKTIATVRRQLTTSYENGLNGAPVVHHDMMVIAKEHQAAGQGTEMFRKQVELYQKMGVAMIDTDAAWVGQYQWPRLGYGLQNPSDLDSRYKPALGKFLEKSGFDASEIEKHLAKVKSMQDLASIAIKSDKIPPAPPEIKPPATVKWGKMFLIARGKDESKGTIPMNFDLRKNSKNLKAFQKVIAKKAA